MQFIVFASLRDQFVVRSLLNELPVFHTSEPIASVSQFTTQWKPFNSQNKISETSQMTETMRDEDNRFSSPERL